MILRFSLESEETRCNCRFRFAVDVNLSKTGKFYHRGAGGHPIFKEYKINIIN